jgi:hypothetical protein
MDSLSSLDWHKNHEKGDSCKIFINANDWESQLISLYLDLNHYFYEQGWASYIGCLFAWLNEKTNIDHINLSHLT